MIDGAELYERLGVEYTASPEEIIKAYRAKSKETHPDAGGDREEFEKVMEAAKVLGDPDTRAHYDSTGAYDTSARSDAQALDIISRQIDKFLGLPNDPTGINLLSMISSEIDKDIKSLIDLTAKARLRAERADRVSELFSTRKLKEENLLAEITKNHSRRIQKYIDLSAAEISNHRLAQDILEKYRYNYQR